jgi:hypothetical protein
MKSDMNGCSTCPIGKEQYEHFRMRNKPYVQYDYRHADGELFSIVAKSLEIARSRKDIWLATKMQPLPESNMKAL